MPVSQGTYLSTVGQYTYPGTWAGTLVDYPTLTLSHAWNSRRRPRIFVVGHDIKALNDGWEKRALVHPVFTTIFLAILKQQLMTSRASYSCCQSHSHSH